MDVALKEHALLQDSLSLSLSHDGVIKFWILKISKRYALIREFCA